MEYIEIGKINLSFIYCTDGVLLNTNRDTGGAVSDGLYTARALIEDGNLRYLEMALSKRNSDGRVPDYISWRESGFVRFDSDAGVIGIVDGHVITPDKLKEFSRAAAGIIENHLSVNSENPDFSQSVADTLLSSVLNFGDITVIWEEDFGIVVTGLPPHAYTTFYGAYDGKFSGFRIQIN